MSKATNFSLLALMLVAALGLSTFNLASASPGDQAVKVCVDKRTKAIYYKSKCSKAETAVLLSNGSYKALNAYDIWLKAGNSGTEADFLNSLRGQNGSAGRSANVFESLDTCAQKINFALTTGVNLAVKSQRLAFERSSGCNVENTNMSFGPVKRQVEYGLPVVDNVKFVSIDPVKNVQYNSYFATFEITIRNYDATSADQPLTFCNPYYQGSLGAVTNISGDRWLISSPIVINDNGVHAGQGVYFKKNGLCRYAQRLGDFSINLNPARLINLGIADRWLARRGWQ